MLSKSAQPISQLGSALAVIARQRVARASHAPTAGARRLMPMPKILLVEDNEMNRDMLSRRLARNGFEVVDRGRRRAGRRYGGERTARPDPDGHEPAGDGRLGGDAARQGRSGDAAIPVIALTANALVEDREKAMAAGCDDFDTKPVELPRLLEKIKAQLQRACRRSVIQVQPDLVQAVVARCRDLVGVAADEEAAEAQRAVLRSRAIRPARARSRGIAAGCRNT